MYNILSSGIKHMVMALVSFFSLMSLYIYPKTLHRRILYYRDYWLSLRFSHLTKSFNKVHIKYPFYIIGHQYIDNKYFTAQPDLRIECINKWKNDSFSPILKIGHNVCLGFRCHIGCINYISIGDNVLVGSNVLITDHSHGKSEECELSPNDRKLYSKGPVVIENDVWIGDNVCILPDTKIGHHSIIGANSVVIHDIPPYSIAVGSPAEVKSYNNNDVNAL